MDLENYRLVQANNFVAQWDQIKTSVLEALDEVGGSGQLILGPQVREFERELAVFWGLPFAVGCASGLDALEISLRCLGLKPGDPVLTTPLSAFATGLAIIRAGGVPYFVDTDRHGLMDLDLAAGVLDANPNIRFVLPVHLFGFALSLTGLKGLRENFGVRIVEDCAQSIGAMSEGFPTGTAGDLAATSFYPTKNLGAMGDGGAVLTGSPESAELARCLRDYGQSEKYVHSELGLNSRLDEVQAALLRRAMLPNLQGALDGRREIALRYLREISTDALLLPQEPGNSTSAWHLFPVLVRGDRESFRKFMTSRGIQTGVHYPYLMTEQKALASVAHRTFGTLTQAKHVASHEISLPIQPFLSQGDLDWVIASCNEWRG